MINIVCLGKIKEKYLKELIDDYKKRIEKYHKINIIELKDENDLEVEAKSIEKYLNKKDLIIICDIKGKKITSKEFAEFIDNSFIEHSTISFVIGSSLGLSENIKKKGNFLLSFSDMTLPHGLFRGILLEQIYRTFKINNNEKYHK